VDGADATSPASPTSLNNTPSSGKSSGDAAVGPARRRGPAARAAAEKAARALKRQAAARSDSKGQARSKQQRTAGGPQATGSALPNEQQPLTASEEAYERLCEDAAAGAAHQLRAGGGTQQAAGVDAMDGVSPASPAGPVPSLSAWAGLDAPGAADEGLTGAAEDGAAEGHGEQRARCAQLAVCMAGTTA
jgi:hypothetical protein